VKARLVKVVGWSLVKVVVGEAVAIAKVASEKLLC